MMIVKYLLISMIWGFVIAGLKDAYPPINKQLKIMFNGVNFERLKFAIMGFKKKTRDGDYSQQRRASCWTNAPLTSPTKT